MQIISCKNEQIVQRSLLSIPQEYQHDLQDLAKLHGEMLRAAYEQVVKGYRDESEQPETRKQFDKTSQWFEKLKQDLTAWHTFRENEQMIQEALPSFPKEYQHDLQDLAKLHGEMLRAAYKQVIAGYRDESEQPETRKQFGNTSQWFEKLKQDLTAWHTFQQKLTTFRKRVQMIQETLPSFPETYLDSLSSLALAKEMKSQEAQKDILKGYLEEKAHGISQYSKEFIDSSGQASRDKAKVFINDLNEHSKRLETLEEVLDKRNRLFEDLIQLKATLGEESTDKVIKRAKILTSRIEQRAEKAYEKIVLQKQSSNLEGDCKLFLEACDHLHTLRTLVTRTMKHADRYHEGSVETLSDLNKELKKFLVVRFDEESSPDDQSSISPSSSSRGSWPERWSFSNEESSPDDQRPLARKEANEKFKSIRDDLRNIEKNLILYILRSEKIFKDFINLLEEPNFVYLPSELKLKLKETVQSVKENEENVKILTDKFQSMVQDIDVTWMSVRKNIVDPSYEKYELWARDLNIPKEEKIEAQVHYDHIVDFLIKKEDIIKEAYEKLLECYKGKADWSDPKKNFEKACEQLCALKKDLSDFTGDWQQFHGHRTEIMENLASVPAKDRACTMQLVNSLVDRAKKPYTQLLNCYKTGSDPSDHKKDLEYARKQLETLEDISTVHKYRTEIEANLASVPDETSGRIRLLADECVDRATNTNAQRLNCYEMGSNLADDQIDLGKVCKQLEILSQVSQVHNYPVKIKANLASVPDETSDRIKDLANPHITKGEEACMQFLDCYQMEYNNQFDTNAHLWLSILSDVSSKTKLIHDYQATFKKAIAAGIDTDESRIKQLVEKAETAGTQMLNCCQENNHESQFSEISAQLKDALKKLEKLYLRSQELLKRQEIS